MGTPASGHITMGNAKLETQKLNPSSSNKSFFGRVNWQRLTNQFSAIFGAASVLFVFLCVGLNSSLLDSWWQAGTYALGLAIVITMVPIVWSFLGHATLHPPGDWFDSSEELSEHRARLISHYTRIKGTLEYWKSRANAHKRLYFAQILWSCLSGVLLPVLIQFFEKTSHWPTVFLTMLTVWNGVLLVFVYTLGSRELYQGFRQQESDFYDQSRRLLNEARHDDPKLHEKVEEYMSIVDRIRQTGRRVETRTPPSAIDS